MTHEPPLELPNKRGHRWVPGVEQQHLLGSDDGLNVLQVDHDGSLSTQHSRRVREQRVQDPKVPRWQARAPHDGVLAGLDNLCLPRRVHQQPGPHARALLPVASAGRNGRGHPAQVMLFLGLGETRLGWVR